MRDILITILEAISGMIPEPEPEPEPSPDVDTRTTKKRSVKK